MKYRSIASKPQCSNPSEWYDRLILRGLARLAALPESKEVYDGLIDRLRIDCREILAKHADHVLAQHTLITIELDMDLFGGQRDTLLSLYTSIASSSPTLWSGKLAVAIQQPSLTDAQLRTLFTFESAPSLIYVPPVVPANLVSFSAGPVAPPTPKAEPPVPTQPTAHSTSQQSPYFPTFIIWAALSRAQVRHGQYKNAIESVTTGLQWLAVHKSTYPFDHRHIK
jgi:hypothetical protein